MLFPKCAKNTPAFQPGQRPFFLPSFIPIPYDELPYLFQICVQKSLSQANQTILCTKKRPFFVSQLRPDTQMSPQPNHSIKHHQLEYVPVNTLMEGSANYDPLPTSCLCKSSLLGTQPCASIGTAEPSSCENDPVTLRAPNIYCLALYRKRLLSLI